MATVFGLSFVVRAGLIALNEQIRFFEAKQAGNNAIFLYDQSAVVPKLLFQWDSLVDLWLRGPFMLQAAINWPAVMAFGLERPVFLVTNAFLGALTGVVAFIYLERLFSWRVGFWGLVLFSIYPAAVNFSIFGLRDIIIYFFTSTYTFSWLWVYFGTRNGLNLLALGVSATAVLSLRTEMLPFLLVPIGLMMVLMTRDVLRRIRRKELKMLVVYVGLLFIVIGGTVGSYQVYKMTLQVAGFASASISPIDVVEVYTEAQYARHSKEEGGGSNILPPGIYNALPKPAKVLVQTVGIVVIPMPWLLTSVARLFAGFDSVFVIGCAILGVCAVWGRRARASLGPQERRGRDVSAMLLICFAVSVFGFGLVIYNAGNAFRMRMPIVPYVMIPASIYIGHYLHAAWTQRYRLRRGLARGDRGKGQLTGA